MSLRPLTIVQKAKTAGSAALISAALLFSSTVSQAEDAGKDYASIYQRTCSACHSSGAAGAPIKGDTESWAARIEAKGLDGLVETSIKGIGAMPAGGLCAECTPEDMRALIEFMAE